ncbi:MAG: hypothetical protein PWP23_1653 [Candidatus Sumerlaeota bacterium]|nr:hypothetical protein [Candidatus Sumerlaeota bacterium]
MSSIRPLIAAGAVAVLGAGVLAAAAAQPESTPASTASPTAHYPLPAQGEIPIIKQAEIEKILATHGQRVLVVNHWATWCAPCVAELPYFQDAQEEFAANGVQIVGMGMDYHVYEEEWPEYTNDTVERLGITFPQFQLSVDTTVTVPYFSEKWSGGLPATFYYDAQGNKLGEHLGEISKEQLYADIGRLLAQTDGKEHASESGSGE